MTPEDELHALRLELEKAKEERDQYRKITQNLMLKLYPFDPKRLEDEVREVNETGGIPFAQVIQEIKARHGITS
jgi:hypothetical protein